MDIDVEGWVSRVKLLDSPLDPKLLARIQGAVAAWRFTPAMIEGTAVSVGTHLYIDVRGRPVPNGGHEFDLQYTGAGLRAERTVAPHYPPTALQKHQQGEVLLRVRVAPEGHADQVTVESGSGHPLLDRAAIQAVSSWTFRADRLGGEPVAGEAVVPIRFQLAGGDFGGPSSQLYFHQQRIQRQGPSVF